jgi:hypothetical protein
MQISFIYLAVNFFFFFFFFFFYFCFIFVLFFLGQKGAIPESMEKAESRV